MRISEGYKCCEKYDGKLNEVKTEKGIHYSKSICANCGHFWRWNSNPNITRTVMERNENIDYVLRHYSDELTDKQKSILNGIKAKRFPTPKQQQFYDNIQRNYCVS